MAGSYQFSAVEHFDVRTAVMPQDTMRPSTENTRGTAEKFHVSRGHSSVDQLKQVLMDAKEANKRLFDFVEGALSQCEGRQAFDNAPPPSSCWDFICVLS